MTTSEPLLGEQSLFEGAPCGLVVTAADGTVVRANALFGRWLGYAPSELHGKRFQDLLTMGGRIFHQTHWAPLMQMQGSVAEVKLDLVHREKHSITVLLNGVRRETPGGIFNELALFRTNDRDQYERELLKARNNAQDLLQEKNAAVAALQHAQAELHITYKLSQQRALFAEQMVAIVSHDLRNPLAAIKMASDMLNRGERTSKETTLLGHITKSSERAQRLVADLLDFALARSGRSIGVAPTEIDLHATVEQCVAELRVVFAHATIRHVGSGSGPTHLDADRLHQLIGNLVANSVAYGDLQRPITVEANLIDGFAVISVNNHGNVIPHALREVLFEPMTRGQHMGQDDRSVGLGLFIVREIARAHGGTVSVRSTETEGTTFVVCLPIGHGTD